MKKKSMVTKREKDLLQYMYGLALNLNEFIRENGYTKDDFDMCNIHINISEDEDYVDTQFTNFYLSGHAKRIVSYYAFGNRKPVFEETKYEDEKDDEIE